MTLAIVAACSSRVSGRRKTVDVERTISIVNDEDISIGIDTHSRWCKADRLRCMTGARVQLRQSHRLGGRSRQEHRLRSNAYTLQIDDICAIRAIICGPDGGAAGVRSSQRIRVSLR